MDRKGFLTTSLFGSAGIYTLLWGRGLEQIWSELPAIPGYLRKGEKIGITSPAGYITHEEIIPAVRMMESWGFALEVGNTIGKRDFTMGGTDEERAADFQRLLDDPTIKAIMCARGGYGAVRIIDRLNWDRFRRQPKWIIGFSDITVFHSHLNRNLGIASIHSKMCNSFPEDPAKAEPDQIASIDSIRKALMGEKIDYTVPPNIADKPGEATGILVGGNLKMLETLAGTNSDIETSGKLLFLEDTGEYLYNIDRMFWNMQRTGKLNSLAGLIIGGFKIKPSEDPDEEFGKNLVEIVLEKVKNYEYPVCFDFPVGHQRNNMALKCGVRHSLQVTGSSVRFMEV